MSAETMFILGVTCLIGGIGLLLVFAILAAAAHADRHADRWRRDIRVTDNTHRTATPMPAHERFYEGTTWVMTAGPLEWMGKRVVVTGEVFEDDDELWVMVRDNDSPIGLVAALSWLS